MRHTTLWSCTHTPNIIDLSRKKKQIFDIEVKGQVPTKFIMVCDTPPYGYAPTHQISLTYLERRNKYLTLRSKDKFPRSSLWYATHRLMVMHPHEISLTYLERQKWYGPDNKIIFKKTLFDLEVKVPRRSLRYAAHRLMVMHPHTKYHCPISKETII